MPLLAERGIATSESGLSRFFRRHRITHKKKHAPRCRAAAAGCKGRARGLVRGSGRTRPGQARLPRRDSDHHQHDAPLRLGAARRALPRGGSGMATGRRRPSQPPTHERGDRHGPVRRGDQRPALPRLSRRHSDPRAEAGRHGDLGQPRGSQGGPASERRSRPRAPSSSTFRPTRRTSTPSSRSSPSLKADLRKAAARTLPT